MAGFEDLLIFLSSTEVVETILPFFLIFTIIYAVLKKMTFLTDKKPIQVTVAFVFSFITVSFHVLGRYPAGFDVVEIINTALPAFALALVLMILIPIAISFFGVEDIEGESGYYTLLFGLLIVIYTANAFPSLTNFVIGVVVLGYLIGRVLGTTSVFNSLTPSAILLAWMFIHRLVWGYQGLPSFFSWLDSSYTKGIIITALIFFFLAAFVSKKE